MILWYVDLATKSNGLDWVKIGGVWSIGTNKWRECYDKIEGICLVFEK